MTPPTPLILESVPDAERYRAASFLLRDSTGASEWVRTMNRADRLLWGVNGHQIAGVVAARVTSRGVATLCAPRLRDGVSESVRFELLGRIDAELRSDPSLRIAQIVLDDDDVINRAALPRWGYELLNHVDFLMARPSVRPAAEHVALRPVGPDDRLPFAAWLQKTFEGTVDCQTLDRWHRQAGLGGLLGRPEGLDGSDCYFIQYEGRNVGALVLRGDASEGASLEIRHLGVHPEERRQGFSAAALQAVHRTAAREGRIMTTVVDRANVAAYRAYREAGFHVWRQCALWANRWGARARD